MVDDLFHLLIQFCSLNQYFHIQILLSTPSAVIPSRLGLESLVYFEQGKEIPLLVGKLLKLHPFKVLILLFVSPFGVENALPIYYHNQSLQQRQKYFSLRSLHVYNETFSQGS